MEKEAGKGVTCPLWHPGVDLEVLTVYDWNVFYLHC